MSVSRYVPYSIIAAWFFYYAIYATLFLGISPENATSAAGGTAPTAFLFAGGWWYANRYQEQKKAEREAKNPHKT